MDMRTATRFAKRLSTGGFIAFGGFHPDPDDKVPTVRGEQARTLILIGSAGPDLWAAFTAAPEASDGKADPLDRHTRRVLSAVAEEFGFAPCFPFEGPPWHPFQRWALKAGGFSASPAGVLAQRTYGPWAGFRAAFLSTEIVGRFAHLGAPGPCEACRDKPCIAACPANALSLAGYDVPRCMAYLKANPRAACHAGCLARRACPVGRDYAQSHEQAAFHMRAFLR